MGKTFKANNYSQAVKEVEALDKDQANRIKEEIKFSDRKHHHVVGVKISDRPGQAKNDVRVQTIILNDDKFNKLKKNFAFLGFAKIILLHDASQVEDDGSEETLHVHDKQAIEARIKKELEAKHEKEKQELRDQLKQQAIDNKTNDDETEGDGNEGGSEIPNPFEKGDTIDAMKEFAEENDIDLSGLKLKDEIKATLTTWFNEQSESK